MLTIKILPGTPMTIIVRGRATRTPTKHFRSGKISLGKAKIEGRKLSPEWRRDIASGVGRTSGIKEVIRDVLRLIKA